MYSSTNDLYVYVHVPFCVKRCFYCDFVSSTRLDLMNEYLDALIEDIRLSGYLTGRRIVTVYFGGGTPSLVPAEFLERVLEVVVGDSGSFDPIEITIELNPESTYPDAVKRYSELGVNRVSLGIQAFDDRVLRLSGRPHGTAEILDAVQTIRENFTNINFDFIIGLPGYDEGVIESNLKLIEVFEPEHVSVYLLELDEGTPLHGMVRRGEVELPGNTEELFDSMISELEKMGYTRYEISNFSKPGFESIHNRAYWLNLDYVGFGVSAGGHIGNLRYVRTLSLFEYLRNPFSNSHEHENSEIEELAETLFMNLRLVEGVDIERLMRKFGDLFGDFLEHVKGSEYFEISGGKLKLSKKGLDFSKEALEEVVIWRDGVLDQVSE